MTGHAPIPFRTAASGDPSLVGKWVILPDLAGPVFVSDTGVVCKTSSNLGGPPARGSSRGYSRRRKPSKSKGCVSSNQLDIFVGGPEWHKAAARMGVMEWEGEVVK